MPLVADSCICLRRIEYSETSQILWLFCRRQGLVKAIAKGAHRKTKVGASKFDGGVDLLDAGEAVMTDHLNRDLVTLTEWKLRDGRLGLRKNLRALFLAQYTAEVLTKMLELNDPHEPVFDRLDAMLGELATRRREEVFLAFHLDFLRDAGFLPELSACVSCGTAMTERDATYFSPARGGILCRNCEPGFPDRLEIDGRLIRIAVSILRLPPTPGLPPRLPGLTRHQTDPLNGLLAAYVQHTLGRRLETWRYIRGGADATGAPRRQPRQ